MALSVQQRGGVFLIATACLMTVGICAPFGGHDLQRGMQIAIGFCAVLYGLSVTSTEPWVDRPTAWGVALVVGLGLLSSALAHQPLWALTEVALGRMGKGAVAFGDGRAASSLTTPPPPAPSAHPA